MVACGQKLRAGKSNKYAQPLSVTGCAMRVERVDTLNRACLRWLSASLPQIGVVLPVTGGRVEGPHVRRGCKNELTFEELKREGCGTSRG